MVNTVNGGDCEIVVEFDVGTKKYKIIRGIKPNIFEIYQDGQLINQDASNIDYQKYLENSLIEVKDVFRENYKDQIIMHMIIVNNDYSFLEMNFISISHSFTINFDKLLELKLNQHKNLKNKSVSDITGELLNSAVKKPVQ